MGLERVGKAFEKGTLEIAPLAFMRGRTLNHAFVILDEAQNTTPEQMKMFLTRIGFGTQGGRHRRRRARSTCPRARVAGLVDAERVLRGVRGIATRASPSADVVRHPLVARIVEAYDAARREDAALSRRAARPRVGGRRCALSLQFADARASRAAAARTACCAGSAPRSSGRPRSRCASSTRDEGRALNREFRGKDYATNVLTFDYEREPVVVADLVLCAPVVEREAREQGIDARGALRAPARARRAARAGLRPRARRRGGGDGGARERRCWPALGFADPYAR